MGQRLVWGLWRKWESSILKLLQKMLRRGLVVSLLGSMDDKWSRGCVWWQILKYSAAVTTAQQDRDPGGGDVPEEWSDEFWTSAILFLWLKTLGMVYQWWGWNLNYRGCYAGKAMVYMSHALWLGVAEIIRVLLWPFQTIFEPGMWGQRHSYMFECI